MTKPIATLLFSASLFLYVVSASSCSKNQSTDSNAINVQNISGTYKLTGLTVTLAPLPPQSILDSVPACQRDDLIKLNTDLSLYYVDAGTVCAPPGNDTSTWSLTGTTIKIDTLSGNIQSFKNGQLVITSTVDYMGLSVLATESFTKQ